MDDLAYLFAAYTIMWVGIFGYVFRLSRQQNQLGKEIDSLKESLKNSPESRS